MPAVAIPSGVTVKENMEFLCMHQKEQATRLDITEKHLNNIINGNSPVTYDTGFKLKTVIGPNAESWMNSVVYYR